MKTLSIALRPKSFATMFGQQKVTDAITNQIKRNRFPAAWLFAGETGSGKTTIARIVALSLQCTHAPFGFPCKACRQNRRDFNIHTHNAAKFNKIEQLKEFVEIGSYAPQPPSKKRVMILDEVQRLSKQAQAVLLEPTEPREDEEVTTVWILATTEPELVLKTIRRRCFALSMQPIRGKDINTFIKWAASKGTIERPINDFIDRVHEMGVTSSGIMLMALERYASGMDPEQSLLASDSDIDTLRLSQALVKGNWLPIRSELEKCSPDEAKLIRYALLGYLRSIVLNPKETVSKKAIIETIEELGRMQYADDVAMSAMLAAVLYKAVKRF